MPVDLLPPLRGGSLGWNVQRERDVPLTKGPRFARTRGMGRWHRLRSGYVLGGRDTEVWSFWCGQASWSDRAAGVDVIPDGLPVCGTCEGRAEGADESVTSLLFEPDRLTPPRVCPGSGDTGYHLDTRLWVEVAGRVGRCLVCQQLTPTRFGGGPYNPWEGLQQHAPGAGLVAGCPFHAWKELVRDGDRVICRCDRGPLLEFDPGPDPGLPGFNESGDD